MLLEFELQAPDRSALPDAIGTEYNQEQPFGKKPSAEVSKYLHATWARIGGA
jgi:hypothetical protein